jgi:hypothetical protein
MNFKDKGIELYVYAASKKYQKLFSPEIKVNCAYKSCYIKFNATNIVME